jgi:hypothetical protein
MRSRLRTHILFAMAFHQLASVSFAQAGYDPLGPGVPRGPGIPGIPGSGALREVDAGVADVDPLRTSLYYTGGQADLRSPLGFDRVFIGADGRYYRISGSLVAAFDRSQYVADANGVYPEIPAGTVFYTGGLPPEALGTGGALESFPTVSGRMSGRVGGAMNASATARAGFSASAPSVGGIAYESGSAMALRREREEPSREPTIATDEGYRASRIALLIQRATGE